MRVASRNTAFYTVRYHRRTTHAHSYVQLYSIFLLYTIIQPQYTYSCTREIDCRLPWWDGLDRKTVARCGGAAAEREGELWSPVVQSGARGVADRSRRAPPRVLLYCT